MIYNIGPSGKVFFVNLILLRQDKIKRYFASTSSGLCYRDFWNRKLYLDIVTYSKRIGKHKLDALININNLI